MLATGFTALLSHWKRRPLQLAMLLLGLSLATALWSGVQAINAEARAAYARAAAVVGENRLDQLVARDGGMIEQSLFVAMRKAGWLVSPVAEGRLRIDGQRLTVIGIDPLTLPAEGQQVDLAGEGALQAFLGPEGVVYVGSETEKALAGASLPPRRVASGLPEGTVMADIGQAQRLLDMPGRITRLLVAPVQPLGQMPLEEIAPSLVRQAPAGEGDLARLTDSFHLNLTAFGFLAFAVGLFIVYSAVGLAFEQRRPVFRTLRALGLSARALTGLLLFELTLFALVAGFCGVTLGYLVASLLLPDVAATLRGLYGAQVPGTLSLRPSWWMAGLAIALSGTLLSAAQSLWRVWRMPVLAPAQPRAWALASEGALRWQAGGAITLLAAGAALVQWGHGLMAGFGVLAALLLGAALLLPVVLALLLSLARTWARGPLIEWFFADTRQQLPGLSLALMALLLALSANIGVGTMVASFRLTFSGWLDQRLAAELYVTVRTNEEAEALQQFLKGRVDAILPIWNEEGAVAGQPAQIYGVADHATYRDNWPLLSASPDVWDRVAQGEAALVNEQLARREHLQLGDDITLPGGWQTQVAGVYSDYGNPVGQVLVGIDALTAHYPDIARLRYGLRVDPAAVPALITAIEDRFDLPTDAVVDQAGIKQRSLEIFERTFSITAALNVLTLGVAGLAMFASLMTLSAMRLVQVAPVWAMGLTRHGLVGLEVARTLTLAVVTLLAALPVGIGLAWVLLAVVNVEAFGWRLPLHLFPLDWLRLAGLAVLAALASALIPLWRLAQLQPSDFLRVFSNER